MQKVEVHSTDASGGNIIPGREDGNNDIGNGSTYQIFRNAAATNSGHQQYFAKDKDGVVEPITGPGGGIPSSSQVVVTISHNDGDLTYTANPSGGTAPYSYLWTVVNTGTNGGAQLLISSGSTSQTVTTNGTSGMVRVHVTDSKGIVGDAYFLQLTPGA